MKTPMRLRWMSGWLFLLILQTASAFYDPAPQRWINRDPNQEFRGGINLYHIAANDPVAQIDAFGLSTAPTTKPTKPVNPPPICDPTFWNDPGRKTNNNCYNYALDIPATDFRNEFEQPGSGNMLGMGDVTSCKNLMMRVIDLDGGKKPDASGNCPSGYHKARVWYGGKSTDNDFHFYRQDGDGSWSHKPGSTDASCNITDPNNYKNYQNCGDVCLKNQPRR